MNQSIDLGLAVSSLSLRPGQTRTHRELAAFCNCTHGTIQFIEKKALKKLRHQLSAFRREAIQK
jgi:DNA-directed RNA polymerase sigma subunit (sigma70/sigma32)